jgi:hexosaminidase
MTRAGITRLGMYVALLLMGASVAQAETAWSLLPQPVEAHLAGTRPIEIANGATIEIRGADRKQVAGIVDRFVKRVADTRGLQFRVAGDAHTAITFDLDPRADVVGDGGYRIVIDDRGIRASARKPQGLFYASVTVFQLLTQPGWKRGAAAEVAAGTIVDHPRFAWRALMLDSGRHFQSVAEIKQLIDWMSLSKLNVLVWHLTEDQGWRIEIRAFPELTRIGACRKAVGVDIELTGSADTPYCGFYSADQIRDIVGYAAQRFVTVVPDLDLPGHSQAAVASYPWLGVTGERPPVWNAWGISPWLLKPDEKTLRFVDAVLDEVMRVFPSQYVSIGGDEAAKDQWNASPEVQAQMRKLGLASMDELQGWFTQRVADHLVKHARTPVGWDDELVAGAKLPAAEVVMSWHGNDDERVALDALRQGHDVIMAPQESLYFDHYQSDRPDEWSGQAPMATLQQAYDTAVIPPGATAAQARHILGVQACLWTELMPTFADAQHAIFPRIAALSELGWSPADAHDWNRFVERLPAELARYRALGIGYADSAFAPALDVTATKDGDALLSRSGNELESCSEKAEPMRVIAALPKQGSPTIYKADIGNMCWRWPNATLDGVKRVALTVGRVAWQFGDEAANAIVRPKISVVGEMEIHVDACNGPLLARAPLTAPASAGAQTESAADVSTPPSAGVHDVCVIATGDPRDGQWTLARITFQKNTIQTSTTQKEDAR